MNISDVRIRLSQREDSKTNDGEYKDIAHPLNTETRELLKKTILEAYEAELAKQQQNP